ncbi:serine hydrolase [Streptomyces gamaensis]|uniref:Serine hydrolase n=1 Tax=Streptomyces gamaensis TaxID=1763542 RepID=A0ABW0Z5T0_9ACTN
MFPTYSDVLRGMEFCPASGALRRGYGDSRPRIRFDGDQQYMQCQTGRPRSMKGWRWIVLPVAVTVVCGLALWKITSWNRRPLAGPQQPIVLEPSAPPTDPSDGQRSGGEPADPATALRCALERIPVRGSYAVAVRDMKTGATADYHTGRWSYDTASIVKLDILAALLYRAHGTPLTGGQRELAEKMVQESDNDAATALWSEIGGSAGLTAANKAFGLSQTVAGSGYDWGLTQTTAVDQLTLLERAVGDDSPLTPSARQYIRTLMGRIDADQRWGISAAADANTSCVLKNGWLPRTATGLWDINSVGEIQHSGHPLRIAILSSGQESQERGIELVQNVAVAAAEALTGATPVSSK